MVNLPAQKNKLHVALVYNQKKEDAAKQSFTDESNDPASLTGKISPHTSDFHPAPMNLDLESDKYAEWDTFDTVDAVRKALEERHTVSMIEADEDAYIKLRQHRPDIVFNVAEGLYGVSREAQIPAMLEMLNIPYTGSDPLTLALCLDKSRAKEIMSYYGIPTPKFWIITYDSEIEDFHPPFPLIVKPLHEGSSKGIFNSSVVHNFNELKREALRILMRYDEPVLVEEYLPGREFTVAVLGNGKDLTILPIVEIRFDTLPPGVTPIYSYEAKWIWDRAEEPLEIFSCPARLTDRLKEEIERICRGAFTVLRCRDWCRIDVRLDQGGHPHVIELNPLPGILPNPENNSCFPKAARAAGLSYNQLIHTVLMLAGERTGVFSSLLYESKSSLGVNV